MTKNKITRETKGLTKITSRCVFWTCLVVGSLVAVCYPWLHVTYMLETVYHSTQDWTEYMWEDVKRTESIEDSIAAHADEANQDRDQFVTVEAHFTGIRLATLENGGTKHSNKLNPNDPFNGIKSWRKVNKQWLHIPVHNFSVFLPPMILDNALGQVYEIVKVRKMDKGTDSMPLSSHRHFPPTIDEKYSTIQSLLSMFHRNVFIVTRFLPSGGVAIVRARNKKYFEIVVRLHAEFQLNERSNVPFWFTPAQFTGSLIISHDLRHIQYFKIYVPAKRRLNVDLEWIDPIRGLQADIGYIPEMSLQLTTSTVSSTKADTFKNLQEHQDNRHNIIWSEEIPIDEAYRLLERELYPFKQVLTQKTFSEPFLSKVALRLLKHFEPPVTMMLTRPDGSIVHKVSANTFFQSIVDGQHGMLSSCEAYQVFLKEGLSKTSKEN